MTNPKKLKRNEQNDRAQLSQLPQPAQSSHVITLEILGEIIKFTATTSNTPTALTTTTTLIILPTSLTNTMTLLTHTTLTTPPPLIITTTALTTPTAELSRNLASVDVT